MKTIVDDTDKLVTSAIVGLSKTIHLCRSAIRSLRV